MSFLPWSTMSCARRSMPYCCSQRCLHKGIYGELNEKQMRSVRDIADSGRHLLSLITDILDVSKMEAGKLELEMGSCDVRSVCDSSLQLVQGMAQKNNIRISLDIGTEVEFIQADSKRLKQMLVNLLSNAVKFTPAGGSIGLQVEGDEISTKLLRSPFGIRESASPRKTSANCSSPLCRLIQVIRGSMAVPVSAWCWFQIWRLCMAGAYP